MNELIASLRAALGADSVLAGAEAMEKMPHGSGGAAVVLPRSTGEVSRALALCHAARCPVVPQGGLTGLVGGAVSGQGEVALSLARMRRVEDVDTLHRTMTVEAGVPLQIAQEAASAAGLLFPLDLGARGSATVGGNIATNAGGTRVLRYGMTRDMVLGLEVVLADGTVLDGRTKILKNNTGYDLRHLFIGSEGTLGVVTRAVLRLRPAPRSRSTALVAANDLGDVAKLLSLVEARLPSTLSSFEVMWRSFYELVTTHPARGRPVLPPGYAYYGLVETLGVDQAHDDELLTAALAEAAEAGLVAQAVIAQSGAQRRELWDLREDMDQFGREGPTFAYDVSVQLDAMDEYVREVGRELERRIGERRLYVFGHVADGNLHLVAGARGSHEEVDDVVYGALSRAGSSVSAEHGIGLFKKGHLNRSRSEAEIEVMRAIKRALDPRGILNPGKIFDIDRA